MASNHLRVRRPIAKKGAEKAPSIVAKRSNPYATASLAIWTTSAKAS